MGFADLNTTTFTDGSASRSVISSPDSTIVVGTNMSMGGLLIEDGPQNPNETDRSTADALGSLSWSLSSAFAVYAEGNAAISSFVLRMAWAKVGPFSSCAACIISLLRSGVASPTSVTWYPKLLRVTRGRLGAGIGEQPHENDVTDAVLFQLQVEIGVRETAALADSGAP